jgi:hypothetical protein
MMNETTNHETEIILQVIVSALYKRQTNIKALKRDKGTEYNVSAWLCRVLCCGFRYSPSLALSPSKAFVTKPPSVTLCTEQRNQLGCVQIRQFRLLSRIKSR